MKRSFTLLSALLALVLLLTACAGGGATTVATTAPTTAAEPAVTEAAATEPAAPAATEPAASGDNVITVATDATWPPFEIVNQDTNEIEGFDIDLLNAVAEKAGLEVEYVNVAFDPLLAGIAQCQYDAAISSITITDERKEQMLFTDPYFEAGQVVTVAADNAEITSKDDLVGKTIGAQIGTTGAIEAEAIEGATLKTYDSVDLAFQDLMNGQVDAVIADNPLALGFVGMSGGKMKVVGDVFTSENYGIAVCNENQELVDKLNAGLAEVKAEGIVEQLVTKWIEVAQ